MEGRRRFAELLTVFGGGRYPLEVRATHLSATTSAKLNGRYPLEQGRYPLEQGRYPLNNRVQKFVFLEAEDKLQNR